MPDTVFTISVILPNYNGRQLLEKNLPSIITALKKYEHEIIVVDDCSTDDSTDFLKQAYPDVRIVQNSENMGFSSTCNAGISAAEKALLCIVNTDVTFTPDYFSNMEGEFDDPLLFAIKGDIINYVDSYDDVFSIDKTTTHYYKRGFIRFNTSNTLTEKTLISNDSKQYIGLGCCFVCDREKMLQLGGFDEIYSPFYWEDSDLAFRALERGYKLLYLPESNVYHQTSSTISNYRSNTIRRLVSNRNKFLFTWRHLDTVKIITSHIPITMLNLLFRWLILDWRYYAAFFWALTRKLQFYRKAT
jgi:GT2 family glycosyltransferase